MEILQPEVAATLLEITLQGACCLADYGGFPMVLDGVGESEEYVLKKLVNGFVAAALYTIFDGTKIHRHGNHIGIVWILQEKKKDKASILSSPWMDLGRVYIYILHTMVASLLRKTWAWYWVTMMSQQHWVCDIKNTEHTDFRRQCTSALALINETRPYFLLVSGNGIQVCPPRLYF